ncbi:MAG: hypothetical protein GY832_10900 [Chloroflexi bacterium]|nr:hypothetical protein [Chloroflexota bacterium]
MKNLRLVWLAAIVLILATMACGGQDAATPETPPTSEPPPTSAVSPTMMPTNTPKAPPPTDVPEGASIEITNESGRDIWYVYLSPSKTDGWGEDWLGDVIIRDGEAHTIYGVSEGIYDVLAKDEDGEQIEIFWSVDLEGGMTWSVSGLASLQITNDTDKTIGYLYIAPTDDDTWGDDWLGEDVIPACETYTVEGVSNGFYDIRAKDMDEEFIEAIYNVNLDGTDTWTVIGKTFLPSNADLRFEDDWTNNSNNWGSDTEGERVHYMRPADGEYCIRVKVNNQTGMEWYEPFTTDEFVAEVACSIDGAEDATCGLGFGPDIDNIYWLEISPSEQAYALFLREDGEWKDNLADWDISKHIIPDSTNYLRLERVGGVVSLYVNAILMGEADGKRFPMGRVGIGGSTYDTADATICMDNLRVWRLE